MCDTHERVDEVKRWGHTCHVLESIGKLVLYGGFGPSMKNSRKHSRLSEVLMMDMESKDGWRLLNINGTPPVEREHHASCILSERFLVVFGGRTNPNHPLNDIHIVDVLSTDPVWIQPQLLNTPPCPRWRHTLTPLNTSEAILYGGLTCSNVLNDIYLLRFNVPELTIDFVELTNTLTGPLIPPSRHSHTACVINNNLYLHGGLEHATDRTTKPSDNNVYVIDTEAHTIDSVQVTSTCQARYSHQMIYLNSIEALVLIGGFTELDQFDQIEYLSMTSKEWKSAPITLCQTHISHMLLLKHQAVVYKSSIWIIGGGSLCFSFGNWFNPNSKITISVNTWNWCTFTDRTVTTTTRDPPVSIQEPYKPETLSYSCTRCEASFQSRNQLFKHLDKFKHRNSDYLE